MSEPPLTPKELLVFLVAPKQPHCNGSTGRLPPSAGALGSPSPRGDSDRLARNRPSRFIPGWTGDAASSEVQPQSSISSRNAERHSAGEVETVDKINEAPGSLLYLALEECWFKTHGSHALRVQSKNAKQKCQTNVFFCVDTFFLGLSVNHLSFLTSGDRTGAEVIAHINNIYYII